MRLRVAVVAVLVAQCSGAPEPGADAAADLAVFYFNDVGAPCTFPTATDDGGVAFVLAPSIDCRALCASSDPPSGMGTCTVACADDADCPPSSVTGGPLSCVPVAGARSGAKICAPIAGGD